MTSITFQYKDDNIFQLLFNI